jgi:hypothetical protein
MRIPLAVRSATLGMTLRKGFDLSSTPEFPARRISHDPIKDLRSLVERSSFRFT